MPSNIIRIPTQSTPREKRARILRIFNWKGDVNLESKSHTHHHKHVCQRKLLDPSNAAFDERVPPNSKLQPGPQMASDTRPPISTLHAPSE